MSLVKWVNSNEVHTADHARVLSCVTVPVIPLADLTELVEGLDAWTYANMSDDFQAGQHNAFMRLLDKLEAHRKE